ncbi:MAG: hypothetical protein JWM86_2293, partial [Thermoleophilia bacterium]|nr:hypothetical protein [Thermoleophilia bacterium]
MSRELQALLEVAIEASRAAATVALDWQRRPGLCVDQKAGRDDLVSQADREAEAAAREVIRAARPRDGILGEEAGEQHGTSGYRWLVDPIDGTTNYLYGRSDWAVSIAIEREADGRIVVGVVEEPALDRCTHAVRGGGAWAGTERCDITRDRPLIDALVEVNHGRPDQRECAGDVFGALIDRARDVRRGGSAACALAQVATGRADAYWGPGLRP